MCLPPDIIGPTARARNYKTRVQKCLHCEKLFVSTYRNRGNGCCWKLYCSHSCTMKSRSQRGERHYGWKEKPSYQALHEWVRKNSIIPAVCAHCSRPKRLDAANVSKEYKRDLSDWIFLCKSCHAKFDKITTTRTPDGRFAHHVNRNSFIPYPAAYRRKHNLNGTT